MVTVLLVLLARISSEVLGELQTLGLLLLRHFLSLIFPMLLQVFLNLAELSPGQIRILQTQTTIAFTEMA